MAIPGQQPPKTGFRFNFSGVNLTQVPDSVTPDKAASAFNIRSFSPGALRTRPGYTIQFSTNAGNAITDMAAYSAIETDNTPQILSRDSAGNIWLGNNTSLTAINVGNMAGPQGNGVCMLPWRPSQSPQTWMYVASQNDYQKFSAPDSNGNVTQFKVGIAEPQIQLEAAPVAPLFTNFTGNAGNWNNSGTAGNVSNANILSDTVAGTPLVDPVRNNRQSVPVSINYYLTGSIVNVNNSTNYEVQDVLPPVANSTISAIQYSGNNNNGNCVVVCGALPIGEGPTSPTILGSLRRGAIVNIGNNSSNENCFVQSATTASNGSIQFVTSTNTTRAANDSITGIRSIILDGAPISANQTIVMPSIDTSIGATSGTVDTSGISVTWVSGSQFQVNMIGGTIVITGLAYQVAAVIDATHLQLTASAGTQTGAAYSFPSIGGVGTVTQTLSPNPFKVGLGGSQTFPTEDDYVRVVVLTNNIAQFVSIQIVFTTDTYGTFTYTQNTLDLVAGELAIISFPISALTASGSHFSLEGVTQVSVSVTTTGSQAFQLGSFILSGGGLPDIGDTGAPYRYRFVGRSSLTGATSNPSPDPLYGVSPRRQNVTVPTPSVVSAFPASDPQIDTYDIYRYGGSINSFRYIGSITPGSTFTDQYFDDTAQAGQAIPDQNFEPWPSVDVPFSASVSAGATITVVGNQITVSGASIVWPATISRWLPGTIVLLNGQVAYTLRRRPQMLSPTSYLFEIIDSAGSLSPTSFAVNEPDVARQILPYIWGPDANGFFFGVGDPLRPGVISFCQSNSPDMVAAPNTNEPSPPSEPLLGGRILEGLSYVASSSRWWSMRGNFIGTSTFQPFQEEVPRGLATPYGICDDGQSVYFWAKDGIYAVGARSGSLTDDLFLMFPHENIQGQNITRNGITYYAPDYSRASTFRLSTVNGFLYADYQDFNGVPHTIWSYLPMGGWCTDVYANQIISRCVLPGPEGTLTSTLNRTYGIAVWGDNAGNVYVETDNTGDNGQPISGMYTTFEWDGEPLRQGGTWEDFYLDCVPRSGITVTPVMFGQQMYPPTVIAPDPNRQLDLINVASGSLARYLGLQIFWTDYTTP